MSIKKEIVNCCPHTVSVIAGSVYDPSSKKNRGGTEILRFPASGILASARSAVTVMPPLEVNGVSVPIVRRKFENVTELPNDRNKLYIVSSLYAQAAEELGRDTSNLLTPHGAVYDDRGEQIGCISLACYEEEAKDIASTLFGCCA